MKKVIRICIPFVACAMIFSACKKDNAEPTPDTRFPLPLITKSTTGDESISGKDPASFRGEFVVDMYCGTGVKPNY